MVDAAYSAALTVTNCIFVCLGGGFLVALCSSAENEDLSEEVRPPVKTRKKMVEVVVARGSTGCVSAFEEEKKEKNFELVALFVGDCCVELR